MLSVLSILAFLFLLGLSFRAPVVSAVSSVTIPQNQDFIVSTLTVQRDDRIDWFFSSSGQVDFRISLEGGRTFVTVIGTEGEGRFTAPINGTFNFKFENLVPDASVNVTYSISEFESVASFALMVVLVVLIIVMLILLIAFVTIRGRSPIPPR